MVWMESVFKEMDVYILQGPFKWADKVANSPPRHDDSFSFSAGSLNSSNLSLLSSVLTLILNIWSDTDVPPCCSPWDVGTFIYNAEGCI